MGCVMKKYLWFISLTFLSLLILILIYTVYNSNSSKILTSFATTRKEKSSKSKHIKFLSSTNNSISFIDYGPYAAHRGEVSKLPENSLEAFRSSKKMGFKVVETDLRLTKDKKWILMHDYTLDRTTTGKGVLSTLKLQDIRKIKLKSNSTQAYRIPTLEEFLKLCSEEKLIPILDVKLGPDEISEQDYKAIISNLTKYNILNKSIICSNHRDVLAYVRSLDSETPLAVMMDINEESLNFVKELGNAFIYYNYKSITPEKIALMKKNNIKYAVWTVDNLEDAKYFKEQGSMFIVTDELGPN
ncbi:glycerophosphoryl diester phosphodiesterase [Clostridium amylolyticum]|uniref:Glycerophosphoryl diester phosphodiesterase n=2 Tax=Clostridium amylolyticum TaxID=1121298 RepID=A0A1M6IM28_9CLOT|nr:glycerophosphoryl diester phosphodiesterase [Clostridium amylolyticum]